MNGLFTVIGGLGSVLLSLKLGFNFTIVIALALYACALAVFRKMRDTVPHGATAPIDSKDPIVTARSYDAPWQPGAAARSSRSQA
jgi:hypothetical protein